MKLSSNNVTTFHLPEDGSACPSIKQTPAQKRVTHLNKPSAILSVYSNYKKVNFFLVLFVFFSSPGSRLPLITHLLLIKFISCSISTQYSGHSLPDCSVSYLDSDLSGFTCELFFRISCCVFPVNNTFSLVLQDHDPPPVCHPLQFPSN